MLRSFSVIVAVDDKNGIGKNGLIPWNNKDDLKHFKSTTIGSNENNVVIMGRKTYESLGMKFLNKRKNIVISSNKNIQLPEQVDTYTSLHLALQNCQSYDKIYVIGGSMIYKEALYKYGYLCEEIILSKITGDYNCDVFFPENIKTTLISSESLESFKINYLKVNFKHQETKYLKLLNKILTKGDSRCDRTQIGTKSLFGLNMKFDLRKGFPLLTTKRTWFDGIKKELLFLLSGQTDTKILEKQGVNIWKGNTSKEYLEKYSLPWNEGDMGPCYGFQWRHFGAEYSGCDDDYTGKGVDQIKNLINGLLKDPYGRRHIVSAWNVVDIPQMVLPPCHCFCQFFVGTDDENNPKYLDCSLYQRSADMFLGVPFNIASYALLMCIIGNITNLIPRNFIHNMGDAHIYLNHEEQVKEQITRTPLPFPSIEFSKKFNNIDEILSEDITITNYISHPKLSGIMAV